MLDNRYNSIKNIWKSLNRICSYKNQQNFTNIKKLKTNQGLLTNSHQIADEFNNYFASVGNQLASNISPIPDGFKSYLTNHYANSMFLEPVTHHEVFNAILSLNNSKSSGQDGITSKCLKISVNCIINPLVLIINKSFFQGIFPSQFKTAKVIPIHKKGSFDSTQNYRPISLLSNISKIFEKLMHSRIYKFLTKHNLLYSNQFGFRKGRSTIDALITSINMVLTEKGCKNHVIGLFYDLSKAFDTVDHNILLYKLNYYGIRGVVYQWFKSYLCERYQYVSVNNTCSTTLPTNIGVPQGQS